MTYNFQSQLEHGTAGEEFLDRYFAQWYDIQPVTPLEQQQGIDRVFTRRTNGTICMVEYKTDQVAHRTGNAFIETVSVDSAGKLGWAHTSKADYLLYFVEKDLLIYVMRFAVLRQQLPGWVESYEEKTIPNQGYNTRGLLVPLREFERYAQEVLSA